ncbi:hypothetical protein WJ69_19790 [Burkholderia ubonensis]|uniref:hypothetical protein n=1 Tax=Burkholderia ubonensis TaxID=101571 RepID=UPI00075AC669|nr:hypothetical protein [Burkholderia ubonensis]KVO09808.1 hypothetical protein WJ69_19790 [Burkholderia ubonensis]
MKISNTHSVFHAPSANPAADGISDHIIGGSKQEKLVKLNEQFRNGGLYLRTVSDHVDEFQKTFMPKLGENLGNGRDERYWSSATFIQQGLNAKVHDPHQDRTGLILSANARLGGFSTFDAGTPNVPAGQEPNCYFPANFPKFNMMGAYAATGNEAIMDVDANQVTEVEMDALGIPSEHRAVLEFDHIQDKMEAQRQSGEQVEPTEAKICYQPKDVLGIYVDVGSAASQSKARELSVMMRLQGFDLPLIAYQHGQLRDLAII